MDKKLDYAESDVQDQDEFANYRSISKAAIGGLIFSFLGLAFLLGTILVLFPVIALGLSLVGMSNIKRYPQELIGYKAAKIGMLLSLLTLVGGSIWHIYDHMTEVPPDHDRISFRMLKKDDTTDLPYSERAEELDLKKVFIEGYVRPGNKTKNLKDFILVGDFGSCCFGGSPEITDVVAISIQSDETVNYGFRQRKIAGTFRLNRNAAATKEKEVPKVFYQIDADFVK